MAKNQEPTVEAVAYRVQTPNPNFDGELLTVNFIKGQAFVDQATAERFQLEFPTFQVEPATAASMLQAAPTQQIPLNRPAVIADAITQGTTS